MMGKSPNQNQGELFRPLLKDYIVNLGKPISG